MRIEKDQVRAVTMAVVVFAAFCAGVLAPLRYQRMQYSNRIAEAEKTLGIDLKEADSLAQLHDEVVGLRQVIHGAQQYVPQSDELADVLRGLSEAMSAYGIVERDVTTKTTQHYADYSVIPIELRFETSFPSVFGVLWRIEQMQRLIRIDELEVTSEGDGEVSPLEVKLSLSTFIVRPPGAEGE